MGWGRVESDSARRESSAPGLWRRGLALLIQSDAEVEAARLQEQALVAGACPIHSLTDRTRACVAGTLRAVTLRPRAGVPALEAELYDGTGTLSLCWLGRRRIPGITPGRGLAVTGFIAFAEGHPVMFNPRYELRTADE